MYELHLTNFSDKAIDLRRIEVFDADEAGGKLLARSSVRRYFWKLERVLGNGQKVRKL